MKTLTALTADLDTGSETPPVEIAIPVYNERASLEASVSRLHEFITTRLPVRCSIVIVDNASTDGTWQIARRLSERLAGVRAIRLEEKGRGRALRRAWSRSESAVVAYMDVDLSTDLSALLPLVAPLLSGHSDLAIGTRLTRASRVRRSLKREVISRTYNLLLHVFLGVRFSDAQCGFKAVRADEAARLLPLIENENWFFDTEMLVLAERAGMRIHEVPVDWEEDPETRVDIMATAWEDLRGMARLGWNLATGRVRPPRTTDTRNGEPELSVVLTTPSHEAGR